MSPAYIDHKPTLRQKREHKRQMRKFLLAIVPALIVALGYLAWRLA